MKLIKQISVFVENKSGRLSDILNVIGKNGIDISALSIADTTDFGIVRMIVNDPDKAAEILKSNNLVVKVTDLQVKLKNLKMQVFLLNICTHLSARAIRAHL